MLQIDRLSDAVTEVGEMQRACGLCLLSRMCIAVILFCIVIFFSLFACRHAMSKSR